MKDFSIIEQLNDLHKDQLLNLIKKAWWAKNRTMTEVDILLKNCMAFGLIENKTQNLIGYARVLTDEVKYAFIFDVIVDELYRDKGLGQFIMEQIIKHPKLNNITRFELTCAPDMVGFYERFGFSEGYGDVRPMRLCKG